MIGARRRVRWHDDNDDAAPTTENNSDATATSSKVHYGRSRRLIKILATFGLLTIFISTLLSSLGRTRSAVLTLGVKTLRTVVFPLLRPRCLPVAVGNSTSVTVNASFALTTMILPRDGPEHWNDNMRDMLAISERNKVKYCSRHGYRYINGTEWAENNYESHLSNVQGTERGVWFKPIYLRELFLNLNMDMDMDMNMTSKSKGNDIDIQVDADVHVDWILYMDVDSMVVNHNFDLQRLISGTTQDDAIIISEDAEGINSGVFLIRNNQLGMAIVDAWGGQHTIHTFSTRMNDQSFLRLMFEKDGYMKREYYEEYLQNNRSSGSEDYGYRRPHMKIVRQCAMQSTGGLEAKPGSLWPNFEGTYAWGDFAVHFFGRPDKLKQMKIAERGSLGFWSR